MAESYFIEDCCNLRPQSYDGYKDTGPGILFQNDPQDFTLIPDAIAYGRELIQTIPDLRHTLLANILNPVSVTLPDLSPSDNITISILAAKVILPDCVCANGNQLYVQAFSLGGK